MEVKELLILGSVLGVATITDLRFYRIPNFCIVLGIIAGLCLHPGNIGESLKLMAVIFMGLYPFYKLKGLGAGDIKLIMMLGCFFEANRLLLIVAIAFFIGAIISIVKIIAYKEAREQTKYGLLYLRKVLVTKTIDPYESNKTKQRVCVRLALPIYLATILGGIII